MVLSDGLVPGPCGVDRRWGRVAPPAPRTLQLSGDGTLRLRSDRSSEGSVRSAVRRIIERLPSNGSDRSLEPQGRLILPTEAEPASGNEVILVILRLLPRVVA